MSAPVDVSALRSLALQTKKRKVDEIEASSRSPVVSNTVANLTSSSSLISAPDKGASLNTESERAAEAVSKELVLSQALSKVKDEKDDREDGEISEDDILLASPKPASPTLYTPNIRPSGLPLPTSFAHNDPSGSNSSLILPPLLSFPHPPPPTLALEPRFPPPSPALLEVINKPVGLKRKKIKTTKGSKNSVKVQLRVTEEPRKVDPVKAGANELQISEEEYAESRTLLIELLSWGVEPEYFVAQGFSRKALLVYCRDLKIRLPTNLPPAVSLTAEKDKVDRNQDKTIEPDDVLEKADSLKHHVDLLDRILMQDQTLDAVVTNTSPSTSTSLANTTPSGAVVENQVVTKAEVPASQESNIHSEKPLKRKKKKGTSDLDATEETNLLSKVSVTAPSSAPNAVHTVSSTNASIAILPRTLDLAATTKPSVPQIPPPPIGPPPPLPVKPPVSQNVNLATKPFEPKSQLPSRENHLLHSSNSDLVYPSPPNWSHQMTHSPSDFYSDGLNPISNAGKYAPHIDAGLVGGHPFHHQHQHQMVIPELYAQNLSTHPATYGFLSPGLQNGSLDGSVAESHQSNLSSSGSNPSSTPMDIASPAGTPIPGSKEPLSAVNMKAKRMSPETTVLDSDPVLEPSATPATLAEVDLTAVEAHRKAVLQARKALLLEKKRMEEEKRMESTLSERLREKKEEVARREKELGERFRKIKAAKEMTTASTTGSEETEENEKITGDTTKKTTKAEKLLLKPLPKEIEMVVLSSSDDDGIEEGEVREDAAAIAQDNHIASSVLISPSLVSPASSLSTLASAPPLSSSAPSSPRLASTRTLLGSKQSFVPSRRSASAHKRPSALDFDHKATTTFGYASNSVYISVEGKPLSKPKPLVPEQAWRFVIDISDCEASDEEDEGAIPLVPSKTRPVTSRKVSATTTPVPSPSGSNDALTAQADMEARSKLEAKESEIRRMVELIVAMEKKQKAKPASSVSTPSLAKTPAEFQSATLLQNVDSSNRSGSYELPEGALSARASPVPSPPVTIVHEVQKMLRARRSSATVENEMVGEAEGMIDGAVGRLEEALEQRKDLLAKVKDKTDLDVDKTTEQDGKQEDEDIAATMSTSDTDLPNTGSGANDDKNDKIQPTASTHLFEKSSEPINPGYPSVTYTSPLAFFPLLMPTRSRPTQNQSESIVPALRTFCLSKRHLDPSRVLCQWELQGGSCSDTTCHFTHWKDIEPTDDEIADFLLDRFGPVVSAEKVRVVVRAARESSTKLLTFADVAQRASTLLLSLS